MQINVTSLTICNVYIVLLQSYAIWISGQRLIESITLTSDHNTRRNLSLPDYGTLTGLSVFDEHDQPLGKGAFHFRNSL